MPDPTPEVWAGERVAGWLRRAAGLERQLAPVSDLLLAAAAIAPGEAVLDVGCGTGPTTRDAAVLAGPSGRVTGLDVAADMLTAAAAVPSPDGAAPIEWLAADVTTWTPPGPVADLVLSRFGVMFFSDPPAAVRALAAATRPRGRLAVAVWAPRTGSPLFQVPFEAAARALAGLGVPFEEPAPDSGPFAWSDPDTVTALLTGNGWDGVDLATHAVALPFAGGLEPVAAADAALDFGPTRTVMTEADPAVADAVREAIAAALADHVDADGRVVLEATVRIVTAAVSARG